MAEPIENGKSDSALYRVKACNALAEHLHSPDAEVYLWDAVAAFEGCPFMTARGLEFTYQIHIGRRGRATSEIVFDRKAKPITKATIVKAFHNAMKEQKRDAFVSGPKKLGVFGASYLYPVFLRLGVCQGKSKEYNGRKKGLQQETLWGILSEADRPNDYQEDTFMNDNMENIPEKRQRKPRRKMTAAEKKNAAQRRAEAKTKAENMKPAAYVQYQDREADVDALVEAAKAAFREENKRTPITDLKLYVKPEEGAAYYVINETFSGKLEF